VLSGVVFESRQPQANICIDIVHAGLVFMRRDSLLIPGSKTYHGRKLCDSLRKPVFQPIISYSHVSATCMGTSSVHSGIVCSLRLNEILRGTVANTKGSCGFRRMSRAEPGRS
jgi:hypothetical protein